MGKIRTEKIILNKYGQYLTMSKGCFILKDQKRETVNKYPVIEKEIGEVILKTGNVITTGALSSLAFWEIDTLIMSRNNKPLGVLKSVNYDSNVDTRLAQYKAYHSTKKDKITTEILKAKMKGQNILLKKHGLKQNKIPKKLTDLKHKEGIISRQYWKQILTLIPENIRPKKRKTHNAYKGVNNVFNLAYQFLKWKVYIALIRANLEPYLGFLHTVQPVKPSLVCDIQELYRYLIDDFVLKYLLNEKPRFKLNKRTKRLYLKDANKFVEKLFTFFQRIVAIPRIRRGQRQEIETLICEEAYLLAKYIRDERQTWIPRIVEKL